MQMGMISVRIDEKLKKSMESLKHINWSEILRQAITRTIQNEQEHDMAKAVLLNDKIRKKAPENFNSVDIIRRFREERFGEKKA
jgi:Arc/MetJ-type ribon-helix-helix transcriptional regulator